MNTRRIAKEYRLTHWAGIIREHRGSGMSVKAYCERAGFHPNIFFYWQRKLREAACEEQSNIANERRTLTPSGFTEVKIEEEPSAEQTATGRRNIINVEVGGVRIATDSEYPTSKLAELIRGITRSC
jgi:transposase-like protein